MPRHYTDRDRQLATESRARIRMAEPDYSREPRCKSSNREADMPAIPRIGSGDLLGIAINDIQKYE